MKTATVAEAKARLSELLGEVAHGRRPVLITKRGRPMAKLVPISSGARPHLAKVKGWLGSGSPFFRTLDDIVVERAQHLPRSVDL